MSPSSLTTRTITVDFLTASYRICGLVEITSNGLQGVLNDATSDFLKLREVTMARIHIPSELVREVPTLMLVKEHIHMACLQKRQDMGPPALARGGYERIQKYFIGITNPIYECQGVLEWAGRFDFSTVMAGSTRNFIPFIDTRIQAVMLPNVKMKSPGVLFNKRQIDSLTISKPS